MNGVSSQVDTNKEDLLSISSDDGAIILSDDEGNESKKERSWYLRWFSPLGPGSLRGSIFNLSILSIGVGVLALPQQFGKLSILLCSLEVIIGGFLTYWSLNLIISVGHKNGINEYGKVVEEFCGKGWALLLNITITVHLTGVIIVYEIISKLYYNLVSLSNVWCFLL